MAKSTYQSPASIQAWQRTSPAYETFTRVTRFLYSLTAITAQLPLIGASAIFHTSSYGRPSWSFTWRLARLALSYLIWSQNPASRPPMDVLSTAARESTADLKSGQNASLARVPARPDKLAPESDALHPDVQPAACPCFWQWLSSMASPLESPTPVAGRKVIVYVVGGGMVQGHPLRSPLPWKVVEATGLPVFGVNFRKCAARENAFPGALQDVVAAFWYLLDLGYRAENLCFMGDSGGGQIVITALLYLKRYGGILPGSSILLSPWVDLVETYEGDEEALRLDILNPEMLSFAAYQYTENRPDLRATLLSPSKNKLPEGYSFSGFPKTLMCYGDVEMFAPSVVDLIGHLRNAGVEVDVVVGKDDVHVYPYMVRDVSKDEFYARTKALLL